MRNSPLSGMPAVGGGATTGAGFFFFFFLAFFFLAAAAFFFFAAALRFAAAFFCAGVCAAAPAATSDPPDGTSAEASMPPLSSAPASRPTTRYMREVRFIVSLLPVGRRSARAERALEVPVAAEAVERPAADLARPLEREVLRLGVVEAARRTAGAVGLRSALVEVLLVPLGRDAGQGHRQVAATEARRRCRGVLLGLRVLGQRRDAEVDARKRLRLDDAVRAGAARAGERRARMRLVAARHDPAVGAGAPERVGLVARARVRVAQVALAAREDHPEVRAVGLAAGVATGLQPEGPVQG